MNNKNTLQEPVAATAHSWSFRREITLGHVVQVLVLIGTVMVGWCNLQKELVLIRHELSQINSTQAKFGTHIDSLVEKTHDHEYRLKYLEKQAMQAGRWLSASANELPTLREKHGQNGRGTID
jgi:hypothetical protein